MSAQRRAPATRHALLRVRRRLERVRTAAELLTRKRKALINELFLAARPVLEGREAVEWQAAIAYRALLQAEAERGGPLIEALARPVREIGIDLQPQEVWGLPGAEIVAHDPVRRAAAARGFPPGPSGPGAIDAAEAFERLTALLLDAASRELRIRRLARALADTSRRVNLLERRIAPALGRDATRIGATLEEREREEQLRYRRLIAPAGGSLGG